MVLIILAVLMKLVLVRVLNRVEPGMIDEKGGGGTVLVVKRGEVMSGINVMRSSSKAAWRINVDRKGDVSTSSSSLAFVGILVATQSLRRVKLAGAVKALKQPRR